MHPASRLGGHRAPGSPVSLLLGGTVLHPFASATGGSAPSRFVDAGRDGARHPVGLAALVRGGRTAGPHCLPLPAMVQVPPGLSSVIPLGGPTRVRHEPPGRVSGASSAVSWGAGGHMAALGF